MPDSHTTRTVQIRIDAESTVSAVEVGLIGTRTDMQTARAAFRCISRIDEGDFNACGSRLVFDKAAELSERPAVQIFGHKRSGASAYARQIFQHNSLSVGFGVLDDALTDVMVRVLRGFLHITQLFKQLQTFFVRQMNVTFRKCFSLRTLHNQIRRNLSQKCDSSAIASDKPRIALSVQCGLSLHSFLVNAITGQPIVKPINQRLARISYGYNNVENNPAFPAVMFRQANATLSVNNPCKVSFLRFGQVSNRWLIKRFPNLPKVFSFGHAKSRRPYSNTALSSTWQQCCELLISRSRVVLSNNLIFFWRVIRCATHLFDLSFRNISTANYTIAFLKEVIKNVRDKSFLTSRDTPQHALGGATAVGLEARPCGLKRSLFVVNKLRRVESVGGRDCDSFHAQVNTQAAGWFRNFGRVRVDRDVQVKLAVPEQEVCAAYLPRPQLLAHRGRHLQLTRYFSLWADGQSGFAEVSRKGERARVVTHGRKLLELMLLVALAGKGFGDFSYRVDNVLRWQVGLLTNSTVRRVVQVVAAVQLLFTRYFDNQIAGFRKLAHRRFQFLCDVGRYDQLCFHGLLKFFHALIVALVGVCATLNPKDVWALLLALKGKVSAPVSCEVF